MNEERITIKESKGDRILASGIESRDAKFFEGAWYFDREAVDMSYLRVTERTYVCPYKGVCYWIDLDMPDHQAEDVGFVYFDIKPGYEFIKDKIGFYSGTREATYEEAVAVP